MSTKTLIGIMLAGVVGVVIFLFVHLSSDPDKIIASKTAHACSKGQEDCLPDVTYMDTMGRAYTPASLQGKIVVVNFWATWCGPCKKELPELSKIYTKYHDKGVEMLAVLTNDNPSEAELLNFASDYEVSFPIVRYTSDILVSFKYPRALPTTYIFDKGGNRVGSPRVGAIDPGDLTATLDALVAQK